MHRSFGSDVCTFISATSLTQPRLNTTNPTCNSTFMFTGQQGMCWKVRSANERSKQRFMVFANAKDRSERTWETIQSSRLLFSTLDYLLFYCWFWHVRIARACTTRPLQEFGRRRKRRKNISPSTDSRRRVKFLSSSARCTLSKTGL